MATLGALRQRVTIQSYTSTQNAIGEEVKTWTDDVMVPASVEPLSSRELLALRQEFAEVSVRITIRYRPGLTAAMRVVHGDNVYRIVGTPIDEELRHQYLVLLCAAEDVQT